MDGPKGEERPPIVLNLFLSEMGARCFPLGGDKAQAECALAP